MYVYQRTESQLYTAGFFDPKGKWHPESDHATEEEAAARVRYLNGGNMPPARVVIEVDGGNVQNVFSDSAVRVELIDHDNMKADGLDSAAREKKLAAACVGLSHVF